MESYVVTYLYAWAVLAVVGVAGGRVWAPG